MASPNVNEKKRLTDLFTELFILASHLRTARDLGHPETLRTKIVGMFDSAEEKGKRQGIPSDDLRDARYALAAFIDEAILSSPWAQKDSWSARPLQYEFFKESVAGVEFFKKVEAIRRAVPFNIDLLEVYYLCLVLGFEGQYKIHGIEKLKGLLEELTQEIRSRRGEAPALSPHGKRTDEFMEMVKRELPSWVVLVSCAAVVFFFYLVLALIIGHDANNAVDDLKQLMELRR